MSSARGLQLVLTVSFEPFALDGLVPCFLTFS